MDMMYRFIVAIACCIACFTKVSWTPDEILICVTSTILVFSISGFINEVWKKIRVSSMKFSQLTLYMISSFWYKKSRGSRKAYKKRKRRRRNVNCDNPAKKSPEQLSSGSLEDSGDNTSVYNITVLPRKCNPDKVENKISFKEKSDDGNNKTSVTISDYQFSDEIVRSRILNQDTAENKISGNENLDDGNNTISVTITNNKISDEIVCPRTRNPDPVEKKISGTEDLDPFKNYSTSETPVKESKIYTPLELHNKLNLDLYNMYQKFKTYLLTNDQLKLHGFPIESSDHPGRIISDPHLIKGSTERRCSRCKDRFNLSADGVYEARKWCHYHPRKPLPNMEGCPYTRHFPCCNGDYTSTGCLTSQYHFSSECFLHDVGFVKTRRKKHLNEVTACTIYALDCEMVYTTSGMEVAEVSIVGVDGLCVFQSFVSPDSKVLDYNTVYSGVTEEDLKGVSTTLVDVQTYLLKLLNKDSILVGHGLQSDLKVLRLIHENVVDTSVVFPFPHSKIYKKSLKNLAKEFLNRDIQQSLDGHDPTEDARACMELMLYKISTDLKEVLPCTQDESENCILPEKSQNHTQIPEQMHLPPQAPARNYPSSGKPQSPVQSYHYFEQPHEFMQNRLYSEQLQAVEQFREQKKCNSPFCNGLEGILHSHSFLPFLKETD